MSRRFESRLSAGLAAASIGLGTLGAALAAGPKTETAKPASVPAAEARKLASGKLGDFESGSLEPGKSGVGWAKFTYGQGATQPSAEVKIVEGGTKGKKALRFEGTIPDDAQIAFMGTGCGFGKTEKDMVAVDVSGYKGIRFDVRGDENPYRLSFLCASVKDYNYPGKSFVAEKEWTHVDVPFSDLKQIEGWGTPVTFTGKDVQGMSFATGYQFTGPAWFELDNVELYK